MNEPTPYTPATLQLFEPAAEEIYSIEAVVRIAQTPRYLIALYCRHGLIMPIAPPEREGWWFDDEAIRQLQYLRRWRDQLRLELPALGAFVKMQREIERLKDEVRFLRGR